MPEATVALPDVVKQTSFTARYAEMDHEQFSPEVELLWETIGEIKSIIQRRVNEQQLRPIDGARALASVSASLLGYEEFAVSSNDMLNTLYGVAQQAGEPTS